jgi:hypothetical protein
VVQAYVHNPLLLRDGGRKFDMRCWVLVDANYGVHLYRHGVLRVASAAYNAADVSDRFSHAPRRSIPCHGQELRLRLRLRLEAAAAASRLLIWLLRCCAWTDDAGSIGTRQAPDQPLHCHRAC